MEIRGIIFLIVSIRLAYCKLCPNFNSANQAIINSELIIDYAKLRNINQVIIFQDFNKTGRSLEELIILVKCASEANIAVSIHSMRTPKSMLKVLHIQQHYVGIVIILDKYDVYSLSSNVTDLLDQAYALAFFNPQFLWLIIQNNVKSTILSSIRELSLGVNTDFAFALRCRNKFTNFYRNQINLGMIDNFFMEPQKQDDNSKESLGTLRPLNINNNHNQKFSINSNESEKVPDSFFINSPTWEDYVFLQLFKYQRNDPESFIIKTIGSWSQKFGFGNVYYKPQANIRNNLHGYYLKFGMVNASDNTTPTTMSDGEAFVPNMNEFVSCLTKLINATPLIKIYTNLGYPIEKRKWTGMIDAISTGEIDVGFYYLSLDNLEHYNMERFTQPLIETTMNIYYHPSGSNVLHNIFLIPFTPDSLLAVCMILIMLAIGMKIIQTVFQRVSGRKELRQFDITELILYSLGMLCMQGSSWRPKIESGKMILLVNSLFTFVIYTSYAGCITSFISIQVDDIQSIDDIIDSNYKIGFVKESHDEKYLMRSDDYHLQTIFRRGFFTNSITNISDGLIKASENNFGFFASAYEARRTLKTLNPFKCRCKVKELVIPTTHSSLAFPIAKQSANYEHIKLGFLKMRESGLLNRIKTQMEPEMPRCVEPSMYTSAQFMDVYSAFLLLGCSMILSTSMVILEVIWKYRYDISTKISNLYQQFISIE